MQVRRETFIQFYIDLAKLGLSDNGIALQFTKSKQKAITKNIKCNWKKSLYYKDYEPVDR